MRKYLLFILSFICLTAKSQIEVLGVAVTGSSQTIQFTGKTAVFIGDSYFANGYYSGGITIPSAFANVTSSTATNLGISGEILQNGLSGCSFPRTVFDETTIPTYVAGTHSAIFFALGTNDVGYNVATMTTSGYQSTMESAIDYAHNTKGWPYNRIIVVVPYYTTVTGRDVYVGDCGVTTTASQTRLTDYISAALAAAASKGTQSLNIYQLQVDTGDPDALLGGDQLHPNTTGASFIVTQFNGIFYL